MAAARPPIITKFLIFDQCWHPTCGKETKLMCSACDTAHYCCTEHQQADRKAHKIACPLLKKYRPIDRASTLIMIDGRTTRSNTTEVTAFLYACKLISNHSIPDAVRLLPQMNKEQRENVEGQLEKLTGGKIKEQNGEWEYRGPPTPLIPETVPPSLSYKECWGEGCSETGDLKCGYCEIAHYCSEKLSNGTNAHQKSDWKTHKIACKMLRTLEDKATPKAQDFILASLMLSKGFEETVFTQLPHFPTPYRENLIAQLKARTGGEITMGNGNARYKGMRGLENKNRYFGADFEEYGLKNNPEVKFACVGKSFCPSLVERVRRTHASVVLPE